MSKMPAVSFCFASSLSDRSSGEVVGGGGGGVRARGPQV